MNLCGILINPFLGDIIKSLLYSVKSVLLTWEIFVCEFFVVVVVVVVVVWMYVSRTRVVWMVKFFGGSAGFLTTLQMTDTIRVVHRPFVKTNPSTGHSPS